MKKCNLICNLESGKGIKKKDIDFIIKLIESYDYKVTLHITEKVGDATSIVKNIKSCDLVLSIGGDGTFNEIVTGNYLRKDRLLLSHIPVGTTNDIGIMLGMNKNIIRNVKDILEGNIKQMDIGIINNQPFIYVAGFGKFINVPYETERKLKKSLGHLAYLINGVKEFFHRQAAFCQPAGQFFIGRILLLDVPGFVGDAVAVQPCLGFFAGGAGRILKK